MTPKQYKELFKVAKVQARFYGKGHMKWSRKELIEHTTAALMSLKRGDGERIAKALSIRACFKILLETGYIG